MHRFGQMCTRLDTPESFMPAPSPVLVLQQKVGVLTYLVPDDAPPGTVVEVPLGRRKALGVVWDGDGGAVAADKLRAIVRTLPVAPIGKPLRQLIDFVSAYYVASPSTVLRMALPQAAFRMVEAAPLYQLDRARHSSNAQRQALLDRLRGMDGPATLDAWARFGDATPARLRALVKDGTLRETGAARPRAASWPNVSGEKAQLSDGQRAAARVIVATVGTDAFAPFLLEGVTGSGKTEVYLDAIEEALRRGRQSLVLVPEIALTRATIARLASRFGFEPTVWHSALTPARRRDNYHAIARGDAPVVIGARSALFLPMPRLGLIVVDEAHDTGFKQEDGVPYNGRDMAVMRARFAKVPVVMATATPGVEMQEQVRRGVWHHLHLPDRHGGAVLPGITLVDMTKTPPPSGRWISPPLEAAIGKRLDAGQQSLLFLNRRGYAPLTLCRACGARIQCPHCTAWLVEHRQSHTLQCHHCGHSIPVPKTCPTCGAEDSLVPCGPGVERLAEEVAELWPEATVAIATSDTLRTEADLAKLAADAASGKAQILIGTQVLAKGHNFPNLTLVGVIDADLGLEGGDLRAAEHSLQQILQVAGRAGRGELPGEALLQTYQPGNRVMQALESGDLARFDDAEREARQAAHMPPFGRLAAIILSSEQAGAAEEAARALARAAPKAKDIALYGPAPAPFAMLRGRHRTRMLLHATREAPLQRYIRAWLARVHVPSPVRVMVDVDPQSFL